MESKRLDNAALAAGISPNYINAHGKPQSISAETKRRLLDAMHQRTATNWPVNHPHTFSVIHPRRKIPGVVGGPPQTMRALNPDGNTQKRGLVTRGQRSQSRQ
ncbi:4-alpha-glucanotransferase [Escherichia coli]|nr:4-alpha-glucanotransferase [Escherichia coli]